MEENDSPEEIRAPHFGGGWSKGNRIMNKRSSGGWKAASFVFVYEALETMAWLMVASSMGYYLQSNMKESRKTASRSVTNWVVVSYVTSIFGGFLADAYLGCFRTILIFTGISIAGFLMLTLSASIPSLNPSLCKHKSVCTDPTTFELVFWYFALYLLAVGTGGVWPALPTFGANQFNDRIPSKLMSRSSFFNWFFFSGAVGSLLTWTLLDYAKNHFSPEWQFGFSTVSAFMALTTFLFGICFYRYKRVRGQPLTRLAQVVVAAARNRKAVLPDDESRLYEEREICDHRLAWNEKSTTPVQHYPRKLYHTDSFRCLDKAAAIGTLKVLDGASRIPSSGWKLCSVTQVEELKLVLRIAPIWLSTLMFNVVKAQIPRYFVEQGQAMNRGIGKHGASISSESMQAITSFVILVTIPGYDLILVPWVRRFTKDKRGFPLLLRMGIGMLFSIVTMVAAALTEIQRRKDFKLSIFWLCPQYIFEGLGEVFTSVGQLEFFYDQGPDSMRGMAVALYFTNFGVALFLSNVLSTTVNIITRRDNGPGWVHATDINRGRLDLYFWVLAVLGSLNFVVYMIFTRNYEYKKVDTRVISIDSRSFEWNMSELGLMQKPSLFKHMSSLKVVKEEEHVPDESLERISSNPTPDSNTTPDRISYSTSDSSPP